VRVECGIHEGQAVTAAFDSLLLKVVTHGLTREQAIERMLRALSGLVILGVPTNVDYLTRVVGSAPFRSGKLSTAFVEEHQDALVAPPLGAEALAAAAIVAALSDDAFRAAAFDVPEPWASMGAFRN
jgi:acetyl/propionyl-CoA carboxylase alpha subunit